MSYLSGKASRLKPYVAGIQPGEGGWIKLNTNENPYPPSPKVISALNSADATRLRLYPDGDSKALCKAIAERHGIDEGCVFCGNGSDEVIALAFQAFFSGKANVMAPSVSYAFYPVWGEMFDVGINRVPLTEGFQIDPGSFKGANGVVIANPNAPTGIALSLEEVESIAKNNPASVVIVDEAYLDFSKEAESASAIKLIGEYDNILVVRTFSKSHSLAGMRIGYAAGDSGLIGGMFRMKNAFNSYPLDALAQVAATAAIKDVDYWNETRSKIISVRNKTTEGLREAGLQVLESQANFLFVGFENASELYEYLLSKKVLVRYWNNPELGKFFRVSIGTDEEMEAFLRCVNQFLKEKQTKQQ